jgi:nitrous oxidase accessory protein NosD
MIRFVLPSVFLTITLALVLPAQAAASLTRTFVSSAGLDTNPCTITQPCATFAAAYAATAANGIVTALDPGKYGPLTINGAVTIDGNGWASITAAANGNGITINATTNDKITLKGLSIDGVGAANDGILFNTGGGLRVLNCEIKNTLFNGIYVGAISPMSLLVSNTFISNINSQAASSGIYIFNGASGISANLVATLDHVTVSDASVGVSLYASSHSLLAMFKDSEIVTSTTGFVTQGVSGNLVFLTLKNVGLSGSESVNLQGGTAMYLSQVVELEPGLGAALSGTNSINCDNTNHTQLQCDAVWATQ